MQIFYLELSLINVQIQNKRLRRNVIKCGMHCVLWILNPDKNHAARVTQIDLLDTPLIGILVKLLHTGFQKTTLKMLKFIESYS